MNNNTYSKIKKLPIIRLISKKFCDLQNNINENKQSIASLKFEKNVNNAILFESLIKKGNLEEEIRLNGKIALYTVIIGNYDNLEVPKIIENDYFDYYCVTDNKDLKSDFWKIKHFNKEEYKELNGVEQIKVARYIKTHPHILFPEYKHSLFMDGNVVFRKSIYSFINNFYQNRDILVNVHPDRDCIYDEAAACILINKDNKDTILKQMSQYKEEEYPRHNGLVMTNVLYRRNNDIIIRFNEAWWKEIINHSRRDQLSFNYVASKMDIELSLFPYSAYDNKYFTCKAHR